MRCTRLFIPVVPAVLFLCCLNVIAQDQAIVPRITAPVDEAVRVPLKGNVPPLARAQFDQGEAPPATQLTHIRLVLSRSSAQQAALDRYAAELQDKSSPNYHKWLTPEQIGRQYGPADSDIAALVAWLQSHGLTLESVSPARIDIAFSGTVSQVEEAFHTPIHRFQANSVEFLSNTVDPSIPAALAPVVKGVAHLNTIRPRAFHVRGAPGTVSPRTGHPQPVGMLHWPVPELTAGSSFLYIVAGDAATIYDTPNSFNAAFTAGTSYTGAGVTIGIGGDAAILPATVQNYRTRFLGDNVAPVITNIDGVAANGDTPEAYIDTELSGALAPGATIHFYTDSDLFTAMTQAINDNTIDIFSLSFGACELDNTTSGNAAINSLWQNAALQGIAVTVSTGDDGSAACDATQTNTGQNVTAATGGLAVSGFASTPFNIAVGGSDFDGLLSSFSKYVGSSSGTAATFYRTALSYIPESTWNDSTQSDGSISNNVPWLPPNQAQANIVAGSGGKSTCSTNSTTNNALGTCTSGYAKPVWQRGTGVPADGDRDLPDVSLDGRQWPRQCDMADLRRRDHDQFHEQDCSDRLHHADRRPLLLRRIRRHLHRRSRLCRHAGPCPAKDRQPPRPGRQRPLRPLQRQPRRRRLPRHPHRQQLRRLHGFDPRLRQEYGRLLLRERL